MFLYVRRVHPRLKSIFGASELREIIEKMASGLYEAYERDLLNIMKLDSEGRERALAILRWVLFAKGSLKVRMMTEALLINTNDGEPLETPFPYEDLLDDWDEYHANEQITGLCGSFLELGGAETQNPIRTKRSISHITRSKSICCISVVYAFRQPSSYYSLTKRARMST